MLHGADLLSVVLVTGASSNDGLALLSTLSARKFGHDRPGFRPAAMAACPESPPGGVGALWACPLECHETRRDHLRGVPGKPPERWVGDIAQVRIAHQESGSTLSGLREQKHGKEFGRLTIHAPSRKSARAFTARLLHSPVVEKKSSAVCGGCRLVETPSQRSDHGARISLLVKCQATM